MPQNPWIVDIGAAGNSAIVFIHCPAFAYSAVRIRSRISAAAFSVNVIATMRSGSTPCSSKSRYTSTSLRVLPVPALAQTTVFLSKLISGFELAADGADFGIDEKFAVQFFFHPEIRAIRGYCPYSRHRRR